MSHEEIALELPVEVASLDALLDTLAGLWERHPDVDASDRMRFEMGLSEILGNVVEHAVEHTAEPVEGTPARTVSVEIGLDPDVLRAVLVDDGVVVDVDLDDVSMPGAEATSGRGLALALKTLDELHYERLPGFNRWRIRCRRTP